MRSVNASWYDVVVLLKKCQIIDQLRAETREQELCNSSLFSRQHFCYKYRFLLLFPLLCDRSCQSEIHFFCYQVRPPPSYYQTTHSFSYLPRSGSNVFAIVYSGFLWSGSKHRQGATASKWHAQFKITWLAALVPLHVNFMFMEQEYDANHGQRYLQLGHYELASGDWREGEVLFPL
jgi:hypothetical protein